MDEASAHVNDSRINCKFTDCVDVCRVDRFYDGRRILVNHRDKCIDCGVSELMTLYGLKYYGATVIPQEPLR